MAGPGSGRLGRSWRRFRRRPGSVQIVSVVVAVVLVVGIAFAVGSGSSAKPGRLDHDRHSVRAPCRPAPARRRRHRAHSIRVVFPVSNLSSLASSFGFAGDIEYSEQTKAIRLFVKLINDAGGIHGRKIDADDRQFRPHQRDRRCEPLCKDWTEGAFPGLRRARRGGHLDRRQPAVHHPGRPHPAAQPVDDGDQLDPAGLALSVVDRPRRRRDPAGHRRLGNERRAPRGHGIKVGVIAGNRASDEVALNQYLLPDLRRAGITPIVKTIAADPSDTASTDAQAPLVVQQLRSDGVTSVIPLMPVQRLLSRAGGRDPAAVLPQAPAVGLRGLHPIGARPPPLPLREGARRPGGLDHRDPRRDRRHPARSQRVATTPVCAAASPPGTRPIPRSPRETRTTSSRSRARSRAGARRSASSPPLPRRRDRISTDGRSTRPWPRSPTSPAATPRS